MKKINLEGYRFGALTVLERIQNPKTGWNNFWICLCDCGKTFTGTTGTLRNGKQKSCGCKITCKGEKNVRWKGGRLKTNFGYIKVYSPNHPNKDSLGYVKEHRLVMEKRLNRYLKKHEEVHHKNGIRDDNRDENLQLWLVSHPKGQRVEDLIVWAKQILEEYDNE